MKDLSQQSQSSGWVRCRSSCVLRAGLSLMFTFSLALLAFVVGAWFVLLFALPFAGGMVLVLRGLCGRGWCWREWIVLCIVWLSLWWSVRVVSLVLGWLSAWLPVWACWIPLCLVPIRLVFGLVLTFAFSLLAFLFLGERLWEDVCQLYWVCQ